MVRNQRHTVVQNSGDGIVLIQWASAGSGTISVSGCATLSVIVSACPQEYINIQLQVNAPTGIRDIFYYYGNLLPNTWYKFRIRLKNGQVYTWTDYGLGTAVCLEQGGGFFDGLEIESACIQSQTGAIFGFCN